MTTTEIACTNCGTRNRVPAAATGKPRCGKCHTDLPWLANIDGPELDTAIANSSLPLLVDLWAPWCGPCRAIAPALEQLAKDRAGKVRIAKINVDDWPQTSSQLNVQGIPTMILYANGAEVSRQVGALPGHKIGQWIDNSLVTTSP